MQSINKTHSALNLGFLILLPPFLRVSPFLNFASGQEPLVHSSSSPPFFHRNEVLHFHPGCVDILDHWLRGSTSQVTQVEGSRCSVLYDLFPYLLDCAHTSHSAVITNTDWNHVVANSIASDGSLVSSLNSWSRCSWGSFTSSEICSNVCYTWKGRRGCGCKTRTRPSFHSRLCQSSRKQAIHRQCKQYIPAVRSSHHLITIGWLINNRDVRYRPQKPNQSEDGWPSYVHWGRFPSFRCRLRG